MVVHRNLCIIHTLQQKKPTKKNDPNIYSKKNILVSSLGGGVHLFHEERTNLWELFVERQGIWSEVLGCGYGVAGSN